MTSQSLQWRPMTAGDLDGVVEIAHLSFPDHVEDRSCFENRLETFAEGCFVLGCEKDRIHGYLVAYPWKGESAPSLNSRIERLPDEADRLYLHDLALHPQARGAGWTRPMVEQLVRQARTGGWPILALVAVNQATAFWEGLGFSVVDDQQVQARLASYGPDARYMVWHLHA